jgi:predicted acylesterase/phospholipase RssA
MTVATTNVLRLSERISSNTTESITLLDREIALSLALPLLVPPTNCFNPRSEGDQQDRTYQVV